MAITLDSMVRNATLSQKANVSALIKADQATGAFDLASQRIGQQVNATNVQLSAFGQVKSSFVDVQSAGKTLTTPAKSATIEDVTKAVQAFADAYNNASSVVNTALKGDGKSTGTLAGDGHANLASYDLKRLVISGSNTADLKKLGVSVGQNGSVSVDVKALQSAFQANPSSVQDTLAKVGAQAVQISQQELASTGNIGSSVNALNIRSKTLTSRATEQQTLAANSLSTVKQQTDTINNNAASGIAAYMQMFTL
jgi:flagellar hook-associated protein 2